MLYEKTTNGTNRLFLYRNEFPENNIQLTSLLIVLGCFSIWGNADKNENDFMSWEFPDEISEHTIKLALNRLNCKI